MRYMTKPHIRFKNGAWSCTVCMQLGGYLFIKKMATAYTIRELCEEWKKLQ